MSFNFLPADRDQLFMLPPSMREWISEGDLAWFIIDVVDSLDLSAMYGRYRSDGWGRASYDPKMMVTLLLYAYCLGERSSRRIERFCKRDAGYRVVAANQTPDHTTISRFLKEHAAALADLFTQGLELCGKAGLVHIGVVALDGSKMKANAGLSANRKYGAIRKEIERILQEALDVDAAEDTGHGVGTPGDELPAELRDQRTRIERLRECQRQLETEAQERAAERQRRIDAKAAEEAATGKKTPGRKLHPANPEPAADKQANPTDPDSRIMRRSAGGHVQGYNAQAVVATGQIIVAADVTQEANDYNQLLPMMELADRELEAAGVRQRIGVGLADTGYCTEENLVALEQKADGPEMLVATKKASEHRASARDEPPSERPVESGDVRKRMEQRIESERGRKLYAQRSAIAEPVFGQIKTAQGIDRFRRRGHTAVRDEWKLICLSHNLLKLFRRVGAVCLPQTDVPFEGQPQAG
jgi:transposase